MLTGPEQLFFSIPDLAVSGSHTLACVQWGDPEASRVVVCVHGLTRNGRDFDYLAQALVAEGDCRVLCPDMPGRGLSEPLADASGYSYPAYVNDITNLLGQLVIDKVQWVGTSMGGIIGASFAATHPGRITALVLNDVGDTVSGEGLSRILTYATGAGIYETEAELQARMRELFAPFGITDEAHWQHLFAHSIRRLPGGQYTLAYDPALTAALPPPDQVQDIDLSPLFAAVRAIPTLLIRGESSDLITAETARAMARDNLTFHEVSGAGHAPALMDARDTALIRDWLKQQA